MENEVKDVGEREFTYYIVQNILQGYNVKILNVKIIPVKHLSLLDMMIRNTYAKSEDFIGKVYVTEKAIEKYNIDINKTYVGSLLYNTHINVQLPAIVNLNYDNGIPYEAGVIYNEEKQKQIDKAYNEYVNEYGSNFMDDFSLRLGYIYMIDHLDPYRCHDFNIWKKYVASILPTYMNGVYLHKDIPYDSINESFINLGKALYRPVNERPVFASEKSDTFYIESYDGITDIYDYGLDHTRYTDYELYEKEFHPLETDININICNKN